MRSISHFFARLLVAIPILLLHPAVEAAPAATATITLEVEIRDHADKVDRVIRLGIAVDPQGPPSELKTRIEDAYYRIQVRSLPSGAYAFEIERAGSDRTHDLRVSATRTLVPKQRGLIGRVARADGSHTEVAATLR